MKSMSRLPPSQPSPLRSLFRFAFLALVLAPAVLTTALHAQSTWTAIPAPSAQNLWSVAHRPATTANPPASTTAPLFVAVGESGTILTSPDGLAWTARVSGTTRWLTSVTYVTGQFIAVGEAATVLASPDGITWIPRTVTTNPNAPRLNALTYGNGTYLAVAEDGSSYTSPDTLTWRSEANRLPRARGLVFAYGHFVVTGEAGSVSTSLNASSFTSRGTTTSAFLESVAYARRTFVAVGARGLVLTSPSAERWIARPLPASAASTYLRGVAFFNHHFIAVGEAGTVLTSPDAFTWTPRTLSSPATPLFTAIAASDTVALTVGHAGAIYRSTVSPAAVAIVTPPQDLTEAVGAHVLLSVVATGPGPLAYQWSFNGQPLAAPHANSDTLLLTHVQLAHAGRYTVTVTSATGASTPPATASAALTVIPAFAAPSPLLDPTFVVTPALTSAPTTALEQPDGKVLLGGNFVFLVNGTGQTGLARLNLDGSLDPAFDAGTGISGSNANVNALALQSDGKILVGGTFASVAGTPHVNLARLFANGSLDPSFTPPPSLSTTPVVQIVVQADGKILMINQAGGLVRLNADGSLDNTFTPPAASSPVTRAAVTSEGKILVGGGFLETGTTVRQLNADGTIDPSFTPAKSSQAGVETIRVLPDGRFIVLAHYFESWSYARFNADGTPDPTYLAQGSFILRGSAALAVDAEGRVTLNTTGITSGGSPLGSFRRFKPDGTPDSTLRLSPSQSSGLPLTAIVPLASGKLLLLGFFSSIDGAPRPYLARTVAANAPLLNSPIIAQTSPQIVRVVAGDPVTLNVIAAGSQPFTTTWNSANSPPGNASADGTSYTIPNPQSNGLYFATISNPAGSLASPAFLVLVEPAAPSIARAPASLSVNFGRTAVFTVDARGSDPRNYQWFFNNSPISPNTPTLTIPNVTAAHAGTYTLVIRNALGTVTTAPARLTVDDTSRLANLATRGSVGLGENVLTTGFVLRGPVPRTLLIRGIGPGLTPFGVTGTIPNPSLTLFDSTGNKLAENDDWNAAGSGATAALFQSYGAFALAPGSADAALVRTLAPGAYTVQISASTTSTSTPELPADAAAASGLALAEIYEADTLPTRLVNLSSRLLVGEGASVAIPGVVIAGTVPRQLLIRAIGPALATFGVTGFLADPTLTLTTADGTVIATNDNWSTNPNAAALAATTATVGAFALSPNSRDAALLVTVPPGNYTAQISASATSTSTPGLPANAAAASGLALVEIYEVP